MKITKLLLCLFIITRIYATHSIQIQSTISTENASLYSNIATPKLLFKLPTRERAHKIFKVLDLYYDKLSYVLPYEFVLSCDLDDLTMNNSEVLAKLKNYPNLTIHFGPRVSKIEAVNRDIEQHLDFDILIVLSDDMTPIVKNYDLEIANLLLKSFPDLDGTLNLFDGHVRQELNTLPIMGKKYYQRFNYVYYPEYLSVFCDLEFTLISRLLQREIYSDQLLIRHDFANTIDALFLLNESKTYHEHDKKIMFARKANNFDLTNFEIKLNQLPTSLDIFGPMPKQVTWSILISTTKNQSESFIPLYIELLQQIQSNQLSSKVEVLFYLDDQEKPIDYKHKRLLNESRGIYISYMNDDNLNNLSKNYIRETYEALIKNKIRNEVSLKENIIVQSY